MNAPQISGYSSSSKRLSGIQISGAIFLLVIIGMLVVNILISNSLKQDSVEINLAGRQRMLSQRMAKVVSTMAENIKAADTKALEKNQTELQLTYTLFDETLNGFLFGEETKDTAGKPVKLERVADPDLRADLLEAEEMWNKISLNLDELLKSAVADLNEKEIAVANELLAENNLTLLKLMNNLTVGLEKRSSGKSSTLQWVLAIALILEVGNFIYIILHSIGSLKKSDELLHQYSETLELNNANLQASNTQLAVTQKELEGSNGSLQEALESLQVYSAEADSRANELQVLTNDLNRLKEESDTIFSSVDHGLCLIDANFDIGMRVSTAMYEIFETEHLSGLSFLDLMRPLISEKDLQTLENYLNLQFNGKTMSKQLDKYNPLKKIEITLNWDGRSFTNKHVGFEFERVMEGDDVAGVLVTVTDVTETVVLENELRKASEEQGRRTGLILEIIQTDGEELELFLAQATKSLDFINDTLRGHGLSDGSPEQLDDEQNLIDTVSREVHNLKGNSSMLGLSTVTEIANNIEEDLSKLKSLKMVTGDEFLDALVQLASLRERITDYEELKISLLRDFSGSGRDVAKRIEISRSEKLAADLDAFTTEMAAEEDKLVNVFSSMNVEDLHEEGYQAVRDILIQLSRNSVVHGLELPSERVTMGKFNEGMIQVKSRIDSSDANILNEPSFEVTYRDDGAGLDVERIRRAAIENGLVTEAEGRAMSQADVAKLIFVPGLSTAEEVSDHAGRGVGMDVVKEKIIKDLKGKMSMSYARGQYFQISFCIPYANLSKNLEGAAIAV